MNEDFIAFLWQQQYFDHSALKTPSGDKITVFRPGQRNSDAGPDFLEARIEIDGLLWVGAVELHTRTSAWNEHGHAQNKAYGGVILHVVWENDLASDAYPNSQIPLLELRHFVQPALLNRYLSIQQTMSDIPCERQFREVSALEKSNMTDRGLIERLERKAGIIYRMFEHNESDWDETVWQLVARYFGARINAEAFQNLAERIPFRVLLKHRDNLLQLEALLFGTANLIPSTPDTGYISDLRREYSFLARKYGLKKGRLEATEWKLLRLRPAGFPTVRIAQLASLVHRNGNLFTLLTSLEQLSELTDRLKSVQSAYWHTHYHFGRPAKAPVPAMGTAAVHILIINAVAPLLAAYGLKTDDKRYLDKAIRLLEEMPAEKNRIIRRWEALGLEFSSSASSQGATEWYHEYCMPKRCLKCAAGNALLRKKEI